MGLPIHYSGIIRNPDLIDDLIDETIDICKGLAWNYHIFSDDILKGISFSPPHSEPFWLTFERSGRLCSALSVMYNIPEDPFYFTSFTKTQFAAPDAHIALLNLIRYLQNKYELDLNLFDEGRYWETGDEETLYAQFEIYNCAFDTLSTALSKLESLPDVSAESVADRLEELLKDMTRHKK